HMVRVWDALIGHELLALEGDTAHHDGWASSTAVAFSPDGKLLAAAGSDNTVRLCDTATGREFRTLRHAGQIGSIAFSPDGQRLASTDKSVVRIWDIASGQELRALTLNAYVIAFSPDW